MFLLLRRAIREMNLRKINQHNEKAARGLYTYFLAENQFVDMVSNISDADNYSYTICSTNNL